MPAQALSELMRLPARKRLEIAESLWPSVADEQSMVVPEDHRRMIRTRLSSYRAGRSKVVTHLELMRRLQSK